MVIFWNCTLGLKGLTVNSYQPKHITLLIPVSVVEVLYNLYLCYLLNRLKN